MGGTICPAFQTSRIGCLTIYCCISVILRALLSRFPRERTGASVRRGPAPPIRYWSGYGLQPAIVRPPWTTMTAYDLNLGVIEWQIPLGKLLKGQRKIWWVPAS